MDIEENNIENLVQNSEDVMDEIAEEDRKMSSYHKKMDIAREVIDSLIDDIDIKSIEAIKLFGEVFCLFVKASQCQIL